MGSDAAATFSTATTPTLFPSPSPVGQPEGSPNPPSPLVDQSQQIWEQSLCRKKDDIDALLKSLERKRKKNNVSSIPVITLDEAIQYSDRDAFQGAVERVANQFASRNIANLLVKYVYPGLEHLGTFKHAVAAATQAAPGGAGSLVWGLFFVVIQVQDLRDMWHCLCIAVRGLHE